MKATIIDLAITGQQSFATASIPGLSPPRFTEQDQLANPDKPMTRLVKDVLRVGRWRKNQGGYWDATPSVLRDVARQTTMAMDAGNAFNLCMTHGDERMIVHPKDLLTPLDQVVFDGSTLYASMYVTPEQEKFLKNPAMKTSPRVLPEWMDGQFNKFGPVLLHVAVCDLPVMGGQGPFLDGSLSGGSAMDLTTVVANVNTILAAAGMGPLPEGLDEATFPTALQTAAAMCSTEDAADTTTETETPVLDDVAEGDPLDMSARLDRIENTLMGLTLAPTKVAFEAKLTALGTKGVPSKSIEAARKSGEKHGWDMSLLTPLEEVGVIDMSRKGRSQATTGAPQIPASEPPKKRTPEEIAAAVKRLGG